MLLLWKFRKMELNLKKNFRKHFTLEFSNFNYQIANKKSYIYIYKVENVNEI